MNNIPLYLTGSAACLAVFYLIYLVALRRYTFYAISRQALTWMCVLSLILPMASQVTLYPTTHNLSMKVKATYYADYIQQTPARIQSSAAKIVPSNPIFTPDTAPIPGDSDTPWIPILMLGVAVLLMVVRLASELAMVLRVRRLHPRRRSDGLRIVTLPEGENPYTWHNVLFISEEDLNDKSIVAHEMAHIRHHHSLNRLFVDMMLSLQWFNPVAWLLRRELHIIHECEADGHAIHQPEEVEHYSMMLLRRATSRPLVPLAVACNFNAGTLRRRFLTLKQKPSAAWKRVNVLLALPTALLLLLALSCCQRINYKHYAKGGLEITFPQGTDGFAYFSRRISLTKNRIDSVRIVKGIAHYDYDLREPMLAVISYSKHPGEKAREIVFYNKKKTVGLGWFIFDAGQKQIAVTDTFASMVRELPYATASYTNSPGMDLELITNSPEARDKGWTTRTSNKIISRELVRRNANNPYLLAIIVNYEWGYDPEMLSSFVDLINPELMRTPRGIRILRTLDALKKAGGPIRKQQPEKNVAAPAVCDTAAV